MSMSSPPGSDGPDVSLYQAFRHIARSHPQATAIRSDRRSCSYSELDARALAVAGQIGVLRQQSTPTAAVVLLGNDPVAEIAAILGLVSVGGVAVPLDASQPPARLRYVLEHCAPAMILAGDRLSATARELARGTTVIEISGSVDRSPAVPDPVPPESPAYVCYTSGSTGEPKGVVATHGQLVRRVHAGVASQHFGPADRHTLLHSLDVGAGSATLWRSLLTGGTLLPRRLKDEGITGMRAWLEGKAPRCFSAHQRSFGHSRRHWRRPSA